MRGFSIADNRLRLRAVQDGRLTNLSRLNALLNLDLHSKTSKATKKLFTIAFIIV